MTDAQILNWLEKHPSTLHYHTPGFTFAGPHVKQGEGIWRRLYGPKDGTNVFKTLREAVIAQQAIK